jgi:hypothetical protein
MKHPMQLVPPSLDHLPSYVAALKRGWSPDNIRGVATSIDELAQIERDASLFIERLTDRDAKGPPVVLPDGTTLRDFPDLDFGFGMASSAAQLVSGGNREQQHYPLTCSGTSATPLCRGKGAAVMASWH